MNTEDKSYREYTPDEAQQLGIPVNAKAIAVRIYGKLEPLVFGDCEDEIRASHKLKKGQYLRVQRREYHGTLEG